MIQSLTLSPSKLTKMNDYTCNKHYKYSKEVDDIKK